MLYPERMLLKLPSGTLSALDALSSNRSDFVRGLILSAVSGVSSDGVVERVERVRDSDVLLSLVMERPISSRDASRVLGWMPGRVEKAERELINAQRVFYRSGLLEAS